MAERSTIAQGTQIGVEGSGTPGVPVAANRRLGSIGFEMGPMADIKVRRPQGLKYANIAVLGKEWAEADISGAPVYTELPYLFTSLISVATKTTLAAGTVSSGLGDPDATRWVFTSSTTGRDDPRTLTIEQGDSIRAARIFGALISDLTVDFSREEITLDGSLFGTRMEDGITLTASPTMLDQIPVRPTELSIYLDETAVGLGTTKLTRVTKGSFHIGNRFAPVWVIDAAEPSYVSTIETEPEVTLNLTQLANAQGMANLTRMRAGTKVFVRVEAVGPKINDPDSGAPRKHKMTLDFCGQVSEPNKLGDDDGTFATEWGLTAIYDDAWGSAFQVAVTTTTAML